MIDRSAGILLPVFSLPSEYGIGTAGAAAREFVDFLAEAGQRWWQILTLVSALVAKGFSLDGNNIQPEIPKGFDI